MINQAETRTPGKSQAGDEVQLIGFFNSIGQLETSNIPRAMSVVRLIASQSMVSRGALRLQAGGSGAKKVNEVAQVI